MNSAQYEQWGGYKDRENRVSNFRDMLLIVMNMKRY